MAAAGREREERHQAILAELTGKFLDGATPAARDVLPYRNHRRQMEKLPVESGGALVALAYASAPPASPMNPTAGAPGSRAGRCLANLV